MALTPIGITSYALAGPPRWSLDSGGLDIVTQGYRGRYDLLDAFITSHRKFEPYPLDGNLFLDNISNDEDKTQPKVDLRYKGCRRGILPSPLRETNTQLSTITYEVGYEVGFTGGSAALEIEVQYNAPVSSISWISKAQEEGQSPDNPTRQPTIVFWRVGVLNSNRTGGLTPSDIEKLVNNIFKTTILPSYRSEEIIPNRLFHNTSIKTLIYTR